VRPEKKGSNLGKAVIRPDEPIVAGKPCAWDIVFTCGERGIDMGGAIRVDIPYGFTPPQVSYPSQLGFTTVETSNADVELSIHLTDPQKKAPNQGTWGVYLFIQVEKGELYSGDTVMLHYGKGHGTSLSNVGAFARYFEGKAEFTVLADPDGFRSAPHGGFFLVDDPQPCVQVVGDKASHLFAVVPSIVRPDEVFSVKITARDQYENTATGFDDEITLSARRAGGQPVDVKIDKISQSVIHGSRDQSKPFQVEGKDADGHIRGVSNPCLPRENQDGLRLFWGDIHVMTEISAGLGRPASAFEYARDKSHLDFCAATDGDHADGYYSDAEWEETKRAVKAFSEPGRFVTLLGSEYHERRVAGDKNIYYPTDDAPLLRWSDLSGEQPKALWKALEGTKALTVPHHTVSGSAGLRPWDHHHPEFQRLVEIYSIWGNSECEGCSRPNYWSNNFKNSVQNGLAKGYRLGIIASGDSHDGLAGNSSWMRIRKGYRNGLAAVWAPELTREAVFDALWNRSCYGTSGDRIIFCFTLNGSPMGQELSGEGRRGPRHLQVRAIGTSSISRIVVVRNSKEVHVHRGIGEDETFDWIDQDGFREVSFIDFQGEPFVYYYVRVEQADGELAWSSPIWIS
jgi:hypothetical protein